MTSRILLVEDDPGIATVIGEALRETGYDLVTCASVAKRDRHLSQDRFDAMITDVLLEDGDGLASIKTVRETVPGLPIIVLSAQNTLDTAVRASASDAFEYFPKPFDLDELLAAVKAATSRSPSDGCESATTPQQDLPLIGRSPAMQEVYRLVTRVLNNELTVLITGESGTGKELVAEAIHQLGKRRTGPFVAINAAAIPRDLIESELFGHERGAFTGAISQQIGKFEQANGGTLFLDEIGDMPIEAQTRLLRTLQSSRIRRVGGRHEIPIDVRIIAATNRDLQPAIAENRFREDLFYRLNVVPIHLPPLRERFGDIEPLVHHFLMKATEQGLPNRKITNSALQILQRRRWRGNVRELQNTVFRLALLARDEMIDEALVHNSLGEEEAARGDTLRDWRSTIDLWYDAVKPIDGQVYHDALAAFEAPLLERTLEKTHGNQLQAAKLLGINRNTLRKKISELGIDTSLFVERQ